MKYQKKSFEEFNNVSITGKYSPHRHIQLTAIVPFHHFQKNEEGKHIANSGIGDAQFHTHFVLAKSKSDSSNFATRATIGAGVKAPTGTYNSNDNDGGTIIPAMQMGSGSWDAILSSTFLQRVFGWGIYAEGFYRLNQENKSGYRFGNRGFVNAKLLRWIQLGEASQWLIMPEAGIGYESMDKDYDNYFKNEVNPYTGGYFLDGTAGLNIFYKNYNAGFSIRIPIKQQFAQGLVTTSPALNFQINYLIKSK